MGRHAIKMTFLILALISLLAGCEDPDRDWTILFPVIPSKISTSDSNINIIQYILKQTHEPLFRESELGVFQSNVFSNWSRSADNKKYEFCFRQDLKFNANLSLHTEDILSSLTKYVKSATLSEQVILKSTNSCVNLNFKVSRPTLLRDLKNYRYAPTRKLSTGLEIGLGPFEVVTIERDKITLKRKIISNRSKNFDSITVVNPAHLTSWPGTIEDLNRTIDNIPTWINTSNYNAHTVNLLQTLIIVLNIPNAAVRNAIASCAQSFALRTAFNPDVTEYEEVDTLLPLEIYPKLKTTTKTCKKIKIKSATANFVNWRSNNGTTLPPYLVTLSKSSGVNIRQLQVTPSEFVSTLIKKPKAFGKYDIMPFAVDGGDSDLLQFFHMFFDKQKKHLSFSLNAAEKIYKQLLNASDSQTLRLVRDLADKLKDENIVIPMYQVSKKFLYPKFIKNIESGRNFLEYPEVANLEY